MQSEIQATSTPRWMFWVGWVLTVLLSLLLIFSGVMKFIQPPGTEEGMAHLGWPMSKSFGLGILEISCTLIFLFPRTAVLGAVLLTAYLGGAVATHVRVDDPVFGQVIIGMLVWLGIYLREPRLWKLLPLRS